MVNGDSPTSSGLSVDHGDRTRLVWLMQDMRPEILDQIFIFSRSCGFSVAFIQMRSDLLDSSSIVLHDELVIRHPRSVSNVVIFPSEDFSRPLLLVIGGRDSHVGVLSDSVTGVLPFVGIRCSSGFADTLGESFATFKLLCIFCFHVFVLFVDEFACCFAGELEIDVWMKVR